MRAAAGGSHVHHQPFDEGGAQLYPGSLATSTPQAFLVASPPAYSSRLRSHPPHDHGGCALRTGPNPPGWVSSTLTNFTRWFLSYTFSSRLPDPPRLVVPERPGVVRTAFRPSRRLPGQAVLSFVALLRQGHGDGLSPPHGQVAPRGARRDHQSGRRTLPADRARADTAAVSSSRAPGP